MPGPEKGRRVEIRKPHALMVIIPLDIVREVIEGYEAVKVGEEIHMTQAMRRLVQLVIEVKKEADKSIRAAREGK